MAIVIPQVDYARFQQPLPKGRRTLVTQMEISCAVAPEHLGTVEAKEVAYDTYAGFLMASGNEITVAADQVSWKEKPSETNVIQIVGQNLVSRTGNNFTINTSAIPTDTYDIDLCRPENAQFFTNVGERILAVDPTGKREIGEVTAISSDGKTITVLNREEGAAWTIATTNLDIIFLGDNLDHCECPSVLGWKGYSPTYENGFKSLGDGHEFCEETMVAEGGWDAFPEKNYGEYNFTPSQQLDDAMKRLAKKSDTSLAWEKRTVGGDLTQNMRGIFEFLDDKAIKFEGELETLEDLIAVTQYLKDQDIYEAYLDASPSQYTKLMLIQRDNAGIEWKPFENNQDNLMYLGYKGVDIFGVKLMFREWKGLSGRGSEKLGKAYNFLITPADKVNVTLNGKARTLGRVTLIWFGNANDPYKFKRDSNENDYNCGKVKVTYKNKMSVAVFGADKFIIGVNA
jgi:hypothetical protein